MNGIPVRYSLPGEVFNRFREDVEFYELHDRMILATAKYLDVPIISPDEKFEKISDIETIWK